jgi:hypothetical protein
MSKMNSGKKSPKLLIIATVLTILALCTVLVTAAVLLGTITGGSVTVAGVASGSIKYSTDNNPSGTWPSSLESGTTSAPWYTRVELTSSYAGPVTVTWQLQSDASGTWTNVNSATLSTSIVLTGPGQNVYASTDGASTNNQDWAFYATSAGAYRVIATVSSAP